jgi:RNA polymerase sigma factor (sigma-70 family)
MAEPIPTELARLLDHLEPSARDQAWAAFVSENTKLILHVARSVGGDHDDVMDRYACILDHLQRDDFHRLRAYVSDGRGKFTTWLVVVARRVCLDHRREKYGRSRGEDPDRKHGHQTRGRLVDLVSDASDLGELVDTSAGGPEEGLRARQLDGALKSAVATLAPSDQKLLRLRFEQDLSASQIARATSSRSQFEVYRRLRRVLDILRTKLVQRGVADAAP